MSERVKFVYVATNFSLFNMLERKTIWNLFWGINLSWDKNPGH
jgi:hypothetical protein